MRVSLNWIRRLLGGELPCSEAELHTRLTLATAEVEPDIVRTGPRLDGIIVGRVETVAPHPQADRLRLTRVDLGGGRSEPIVCGAPNVAAGQKVCVATLGAVVMLPGKPGPDGKPGAATPVTIREAKLRGEISRGMLCAADELGLPGGHDGILVLDDGLVPGTPLSHVFGGGDAVFSIENIAITHRPDLWGHWGWAVEIAALTGRAIPVLPDTTWSSDAGPYCAEIADAGCRAYVGVVVDGVSNGASPAWLAELLNAAGVRPISLLVDITNFVMLELGEPMHAFDLRALTGTTIHARGARPGERLALLDGRSYDLTPADLVIADNTQAHALAGIMGGAASAVREDTTSILLEAALFDGVRIRRTRQRLGLSSDSSARFEKGPQPEQLPAALNRALALLRELCPGCTVRQRFASGALAGESRVIPFATSLPSELIGTAIPPETVDARLASLGFHRVAVGITVPWWRRKDVSRDVDLVEEVARLHGYDRIVPEPPRLPAAAPPRPVLRQAEHACRRALSALGLDEVTTYAFTSQAWADRLRFDPATTVHLAHPLSSEQTVLRQSLLPMLAEAAARNRRHFPRVAIYEVGKLYGIGCGRDSGKSSETPDERLVVAGAIALGEVAHPHGAPPAARATAEAPFYPARDAALDLLHALGYRSAATGPLRDTPPGMLASRCVALLVGKLVVGFAGEADADVRTAAELPSQGTPPQRERLGFFCIELERLIDALGAPAPVQHRPPSRFPVVARDYTCECAESLAFAALEAAARSACGELCAGLDLVSIYRGSPYAEGRKAVTFTLGLQAADRTLGETEIAAVHQRVITALMGTGAVLREG